ncbi:hypothetical protein DUI87_23039 [Hirundo rustica rustica]|uniref:Uncharacterized protein n=1 Tax=Hirundo rustica rustica TaxID=333673 RepID=A0A3M0JNX6_HIRRU|nr:hypothetical protein DUI87_23039 [Hirundo rustica rustica]
MDLRERPYENFGDIIFQQTTTKDLFNELYKLTAGKEKLLSSVLRFHNFPDLKAGHQEVKRQDVSGVPKLKDNRTQPERQTEEEYFLESNKAVKLDADLPSASSKDTNDAAVEPVDNGECIPEVTKVPRRTSSVNSSHYSLSNKLETLSKSAAAKILKSSEYAEPVCKEKPGITVLAEVQDLDTCVKKVTNPPGESSPKSHRTNETISHVLTTAHSKLISRTDVYSVDESAGDSNNSVQQEKEEDSSGLQYKAERVHITDESCNLVGAVNKALLKVIRSDSLDEAAEWKRLQQITRVDRNLPGSLYEKRTTVSRGNSKHLFLNLPVNESPDIPQTSNILKLEEKRLHSPPLAAVSNVFSNSHPLSNTHKQMSPIPSPLPSRLPSPQLHHRILPLPTQNTEDESMFSDYGRGRHGAINFSFSDLEPQFYRKCSDPGELGFATRQRGLHQNATAGHFEKCAVQEKLTPQSQQHFCPVQLLVVHYIMIAFEDIILCSLLSLIAHMAKQPQFSQLILTGLVLQTLHQLFCPSLDSLQDLNVLLIVRGPILNTGLEMFMSSYVEFLISCRKTTFFKFTLQNNILIFIY